MTTELRASRTPIQPARRRTDRAAIALPVGVAILAGVVRLVAVRTSYDLFGDEVDYVDLGVSFRSGHFPPQFAGNPFLLHPPLFFALSAAWETVVGTGGNYFHLVATVRTLNALLGVVSAVLLYDLGRRSAGRWAGLAAGSIFALDAYVLRQNGRDLLETSTLAFVLAGYWVLLHLFDRDRPLHREGTVRLTTAGHLRATAVGGGLLLGLSALDKDMTFVLILVPLAAVWWRRWDLTRRTTGLVAAAALLPYILYLVVLVAIGQFGSFFTQETAGLQRMLGLKKQTGFTRAGSPSLVHTLVAQLTGFGVTYLVCGLGFMAALYLLRVADRNDQKVLAMVTVSASLTLAYAVLFGTIEEQFLYFMIVPAILSVVTAAAVALHDLPDQERRLRWVRGIAAVLAVTLVYDTALWIHTRTVPDTGTERVVAWFDAHDRHPGIIGNDTDAVTYGLQRSGYRAVNVPSPAEAVGLHITYITVMSKEVAGNYGSLDTAQAAYYEHYGTRVFDFHERTYGDVQIYRTTNPTIW